MMRVHGVFGDVLPWPMLDEDDWRTEHFHDVRIRIQLGLLPTQHCSANAVANAVARPVATNAVARPVARPVEQYSEEQYPEEQYSEEQYPEKQYLETNYNADTEMETETKTSTQIPFNQIGCLYS